MLEDFWLPGQQLHFKLNTHVPKAYPEGMPEDDFLHYLFYPFLYEFLGKSAQ